MNVKEEAERIFSEEIQKAKRYVNSAFPHFLPHKKEEIARRIATKRTNKILMKKYGLTLKDLEVKPDISLEELAVG